MTESTHPVVPIFFHIPKCAGTWFFEAFFYPSLKYLNQGRPRRVRVKRQAVTLLDLIAEGQSPDFLPEASLSVPEDELEVFVQEKKVTRLVGAAVRADCNYNEAIEILKEMATLFKSKIEKLTILRSPLERAQSAYYYLRDMGTWEPTYGCYGAASFNEHVLTGACGSNWLVKKSTGKKGSDVIHEEDLAKAIEFFSSFSLIGSTENMEDFLLAAKRRYQITQNPGNWKLLINNKKIENRNLISKKEEISKGALEYFYKTNHFDMALYETLFPPGLTVREG